MSESEAPADHSAVTKEVSHLVWPGAGRQIEVFGLAPEHQITHPAADEIGRVTVPIETPYDFRGVCVEQSTWNGVRVDDRFRGLRIKSARVVSPTEVRI